MRGHIPKLIDDEHGAVKAYAKAASSARRQGDPEAAKKFQHIRGEEKHHATELKKLKGRVQGGSTSLPASHPKAKALTEGRRDNLKAKCDFCG